MALPDAVVKFLQEPLVGVLATVGPGGRPQATPVWFLVEDGRILINTARGRLKLRNMETNPRVALTVVDPRNVYRYVQIQGRVVRMDTAQAARDIDRLSRRYRGRPYEYPGGQRPEDRVSVWIRPVRVLAPGIR